MISRKLSFFAMIALFCMIFIELSQSAPLTKRQNGAVAFCDFEANAKGRFTWTNLSENKCRFSGQINEGLDDPDNTIYELLIEDQNGNVIQDLSPIFKDQVTINPPGGSAIQEDIDKMTVDDIVGDKLVLKQKGNIVDECEIKKV